MLCLPPAVSMFKAHLQMEQPSCWRAGRKHAWRPAERRICNTVRKRKAVRLGPTALAGNTETAGSVVLGQWSSQEVRGSGHTRDAHSLGAHAPGRVPLTIDNQ